MKKGQRIGNSYNSIHRFVTELYGKPSFCEVCGSTTAKTYEWANVTGIYERTRENWKRMCLSCHRKVDFTDTHKQVLTRKGIPDKLETKARKRKSMLLAWKEGRHKPNKQGGDGKFVTTD